ncbi:LPS assembly lipoprotein LptE [Candidatus Pandoraea novymonadis]|uniref:LPS-assembly lipoprotein LptE n=1 Tax=Candidatus Pandoraea novymonadis TaxID=1808959 RepID=A0ABX5FD95_9BURK|nr:LPS assembly lipoprotein LptE [Candidatus Pandoraea novymonadis]PSB91705.1 LPS-assembly lipoprotein LptE [Candidatus Pandoraea novymonadis]
MSEYFSLSRRGFLSQIVAFTSVLGLHGCGFQMRNAKEYAFKRLYIMTSNRQLALDITRNISYGSRSTIVVDTPQNADARLEILSISETRKPLSLNAAVQTREYELRSTTEFQLVTPDGRPIIERSQITMSRNLPYSDSEAAARDTESILLYRDMMRATVDQIIRRLESVKVLPTLLGN